MVAAPLNTKERRKMLCPYCGYEEPAPERYFAHMDSGMNHEVDCLRCGETFVVSRTCTIRYTTLTLPEAL
jgi:hypothetical protein